MHARGQGRTDIVVDPIPDVGDGGRGQAKCICDPREEGGIGLLDAEPRRGGDEVERHAERGDDPLGLAGLVPGDPDLEARVAERGDCRQGIGIEVGRGDPGRAARVAATLALGSHVEAGTEDLEDPTVLLTAGDHAAQHGEQGQARDAEPVRPLAPGPSLVDEGLADVEHHRPDRALVHPWRGVGGTHRI